MLVLEYLSQKLKEEKEDENYDVFRMGGSKVETHLAFDDDVILFWMSNKKTFGMIKRVLEFTVFSGLQMNH